MPKQNRMITIEQQLNERLGRVGNASALIERLLQEHFAFQTLESAKPQDLSDEKAKLQAQMENLDEKEKVEKEKGNLLEQLFDIGITDEHFIVYIKNIKERPSILMVKSIKETFPALSLDYQQVMDAWDITHG